MRWWVTTRRLVLQAGTDVSTFDLDGIEAVDIDLSLDELQLKVAGEEKKFGPVQALGELWGAALFGRAWNAPPITLRDAPQHDENVLRWAERRQGMTIERGLAVLLPDVVTWIPETLTRSADNAVADLGALLVGARIRRVSPLPPLERLAFLMQRSDDPAFLEREARRAAVAWGGWCAAPTGWSLKEDKAAAIDIPRRDGTFRVPGLPPDFARALVEGWRASGIVGSADARSSR